MKIAITTLGTRGDIEPFAALAHALRVAGNEVTVAAPRNAAAVVAAAGARFVPIDIDLQQILRSEQGQQWLASRDARTFLVHTIRTISQARDSIAASMLAAAEDVDVLVAGMPTDDHALAIAQSRGLPLVVCYLSPWTSTAQWPSIMLSTARLRPQLVAGPVNRLSHTVGTQLYWRSKKKDVNAFRQSLGLPPAPGAASVWAARLGATVLHAFSTEVVPRPRDWPAECQVTGYWRLAAEVRERLGDANPPQALLDWLADGPPPVFLTLGSMALRDSTPVLTAAVEAARRTGSRVLYGTGCADIPHSVELPASVYVIGDVDHDWLMPQCAAVIHHGGAGTTGAALIAGRPTWIFSFFADQPYWGSRVRRLGIGGYDSYDDFNSERLTEVLHFLGGDRVLGCAAALGQRLSREDGPAVAVRAIRETATGSPVLAS